jgi:predicted porin
MKKLYPTALATLAVATFAATPAHAQSAVTLYGLVDVGVEHLTKVGTGNSALTRVNGGNMAGSRWGMRVKEELGGGLSALVNLESGFDPDTGVSAQGGRLFGRVATVGLGGGFGTLVVGRDAILLNQFVFPYDPMAYALYSLATLDTKFFGRTDNTVKYVSPNWSGLTLGGLYTFGNEVAGNAKVGREYSLAANFSTGPFGAAVVYDRTNAATVAAANAGDKEQRVVVAGSYKLGEAKLFLGLRDLKADVAGTSGVRSKYFWGGMTYDINSALKLTAALYHHDIKNTKADPSAFVLNADYFLSKRTDVYLSLAHAKNKRDGAVASAVGVTAGAGQSPAAGTNQSGLVVGIRHRF